MSESGLSETEEVEEKETGEGEQEDSHSTQSVEINGDLSDRIKEQEEKLGLGFCNTNSTAKTKVTIRGSRNVSADFLKAEQFTFQCHVVSDPRTPPTVRWFKTEPFDDIVRSDLPHINATTNTLVIKIDPKYFDKCVEYLGEYRCVGDNGYSRDNQTITLSYKYGPPPATPKFMRQSDGPGNVTVSEGDYVTFNCTAFAIPEATIVWLQDEQPIDVKNSWQRFALSNNNRSLTIKDVCRVNQTDLTVIQCNASNIFGYAIASGYLNVLIKTKVTIKGIRNMSVDFLEEKLVTFQCDVATDPSTTATVQWYKTEPFGDLVRNDPYIRVENELLIITIDPKCALECAKYLGEYRCVGDNRYSQDHQTITLSYVYRPPPEANNVETCAVWKIIIGPIGLVLFLLGGFLGSKQRCAIETKDRKLSNPPNMYERVDYKSVGIPLEEIGNSERSMSRACSMYEHVGYDSIDQVLEEIRSREGAMPVVRRCISYESIDTPQKEVININRPMLDKDTKYDDLRYTSSLQEVSNRSKIHVDQTHSEGCESLKSAFKKFPNSSELPEGMNTYADLSRKETNSSLDLGHTEVNLYTGLGQKDEDPYLDMEKIEVDSNLDMTPDQIHLPASTALHEADYLVLKS